MEARSQHAPFGKLLRRYRVAAGLSQDELAERAGLSRRGISDLERGARRTPYPATVRRLAQALDLGVHERTALLASARDASGTETIQPTEPSRLPIALTSFVGRERELVELTSLLQSSRLLTLTGPGGIGKTRLALALAHSTPSATFVDLAGVPRGGQVAPAIAAALAIREQPRVAFVEQLIGALASRDALLLLDNCEHVITACAELVDQLLRACPRLQILATSRERLAVAGEQLWIVAPLLLCDSTGPNVHGWSEAERLFSERARLVQPEFQLSDANAEAVGEICRRLDGIPLAIELAAAQVHVLGLKGLAARLRERLRLPRNAAHGVPERQQTLQDAIVWSYSLLTQQEQTWFCRFAVFEGGWTAGSAEAVADTPDETHAEDIVDALTRLVEKSLVHARATADGDVRFGMLETIREYALAKLEASGEKSDISGRHASHFLTVAEALEPDLWGPRPEAGLRRIEQDLANYRAATLWLLGSHDVARAQRLAAALGRFWFVAGRYEEGQLLTASLIDRAPAEIDRFVCARLMRASASLLAYRGDFVAAQPQAEAALADMRVVGSDLEIARALLVLGDIVQTRGAMESARGFLAEAVVVSRKANAAVELVDALHYLSGDALAAGAHDRARAYADECLTLAEQAGYGRGTARALRVRGSLSYVEHDLSAARRHFEAGIGVARALGDRWETTQHLYWLSNLAIDEGQHASAASLLDELHDIAELLGDAEVLCAYLESAAHLAAAADQPERALRLAGASAEERAAIDSVLFPVMERLMDEWLAPARSALGADRATAAFAAGQRLSRQEALAEAAG